MDAVQQATLLANGGVYLTGEDNLRLTTIGALAGAVVAIEGRLVKTDGTVTAFAERHDPNSNYTAKSTIHNLGDGVLTHVHVRVQTGTALRGHVFGVLEIVRGFSGAIQPLGTLLQGYVTANARLAWPGSPIESSTAGAGRLRSITGTDPAANVEISETVPAGVRWRLLSFKATLAADANVANRQPGLIIDDGVNVIWNMNTNAGQTAGATWVYVWADIGQSLAGQPSVALNYPLPPLVLPAGSRIRTSTSLLQVGDNWSAPQYLVEEFIE